MPRRGARGRTDHCLREHEGSSQRDAKPRWPSVKLIVKNAKRCAKPNASNVRKNAWNV